MDILKDVPPYLIYKEITDREFTSLYSEGQIQAIIMKVREEAYNEGFDNGVDAGWNTHRNQIESETSRFWES